MVEKQKGAATSQIVLWIMSGLGTVALGATGLLASSLQKDIETLQAQQAAQAAMVGNFLAKLARVEAHSEITAERLQRIEAKQDP